MNHWLVKQEPEAYSWRTFVADQRTDWTGVRNFAARLHLRAMRAGDLVLFYESVGPKEVVGVARVTKEAFPDPTAEPGEGDWSAVEFEAVAPLKHPVPLAAIKASATLKDIALIRQSRLSVMPLTKVQYDAIVKLGGGTAAK
ncbi:MAG: EVE domain-containing protein [Opitutaceae bacterium]|nr:EVE domain-containing protein [Opitutaceae bacterium]